MKNLMKIFTMVMAGMFAFSCVTDSTEEIGVDLGNNGQTTFTISLEETKTQLGEKDADGKYPLYWCEGDQIAINGVASQALGANFDGASTATFQFGDVLTAPYCVVYPAAEGAGEGTTYPINFLAEQPYTKGTFASGAAPLYGYTAEAGTINLNHLTGVLRLAVKGKGEAITSVVFTSDIGKIAGPFTVDCTTGTLQPSADATNVVTVTFAEPLVLGEEATPIYAAVPAGSYGSFAITLHTANDKMTVKFNSTAKPIAVGAVREFTEFTYEANDIESGGTSFEIDSKDALIEFANMVSTNTFAPYTAAAVVANIDMTGVEWTPIEGFNGFTFDGGKSSGFAINGLNAPLFGSTNSTIQNVNLTNVNIASNGRLVLGAVACKLVAGESQSLISNCHVSGNINVNNTAAVPSGANTYYGINVAGIVGNIAGGAVDNCVNEANITISQLGSSDSAQALHPCIGGIVGAASVTGDILSPITNCVNGSQGGATGVIKYLDNHPNQLYLPQIGGILGLSSDSNLADIKNNTNYAPIEFNANTAGDGAIGYSSTCIGGIFGYSRGAVEHNENHGKISVLGGKIKAFYLGGIGGVGVTSSFAHNHNHNSEGILIDSDVTFFSLNVAGVIGGINKGGGTIDNCTNNAPIVSKASTATDITTGSWYYRVSGVVTYTNVAISNCENKANGDITVSGDVIIARNNAQPGVAITGVSAYHTTAGTIVNLTNRGDININTNMSLHSGITSWEHGKVCIAGVNGYTTRALRDLQNFGNITIGNTSSQIAIACNGLHIGGLVSHVSGALSVTDLEKNINKGNITVNKASLNGHAITADKSVVYACIGGLAGYYTGSSFNNSENEGDITLAHYVAVGNVYLFLGGNIGYTTNEALVVKNTKNIGTITVSDKITKAFYFYAGGLVGYSSKAITFDNCHNAMKAGVENGVVIKGTWADASGSNTVRFGGIVGYPSSGVLTLKNGVTNSANFHITSKYRDSGGFSVGGIAGVCSGSAHKFTQLVQNSGNIYYAGECPKGTFCIAGCIGQFGTSASKSIEKLVNTGNITAVKTVANSFPTSTKNGLIAGIAASCSGNLPNAQSVCTITAIDMEDRNHASSTKEGVTTYYHNSVGAIIGSTTAASILTNCHAGGKIVLEQVEDGADASGEGATIETPGNLNVSNYAAYLSGDHTFTSAAAKAQNCGFISAIDATPQYAE